MERMAHETAKYPGSAKRRLNGLLADCAGVAQDGSAVHVSGCHSDAAAQQMRQLKEMVVDA